MRQLLISMVLLALGCAPRRYDYNYWNEPDPRGRELTLGVGDVVGVNVWDQRDLNIEATIRPDGTITIPLVGDVRAGGRTPSALRDAIRVALARYVKLGAGNEVTVSVKSWRSYRFTIQGEIGRPGMYTSDEWVTVAGALALAGGPTRFADRGGIVLMRRDARGRARHIPLDFELLASGRRPDMNIWVLPGDVIYVP